MIAFFKSKNREIYAVHSIDNLTQTEIKKLSWIFSGSVHLNIKKIQKKYIGPRKTMITPWSTNAVEIVENMGVNSVLRIELFIPHNNSSKFDKMTSEIYDELNQEIFDINLKPDEIKQITDIADYNRTEGLALSPDEIEYLECLSKKINRNLTDSEVLVFHK